jgi:signal transduction histidine kinase
MSENKPPPGRIRIADNKVPLRFREVLHDLLSRASRNYSRTEFLRQVCTSLLRFSGSEALTIRMDEQGKTLRCRADRLKDGEIRVEIPSPPLEPASADNRVDLIPEPVLQAIRTGSFAAPGSSFTRGGSFWTGDAARPFLLRGLQEEEGGSRTVVIGGEFPSLAVIPIPVSDKTRGVVCFGSGRRDYFTREDIQVYEAVAETLGVAIAHQGAQWALGERVKELTCLYNIGKVAQEPGIGIEELLEKIVAFLPPGWQYPEITSARIVLKGRSFLTKGFSESPYRQTAEIVVGGEACGVVEVLYAEKMPDIDEGPFLKEERNLINAVAETIGVVVAHHEAQWALRERVKELTCLYGIAKVASRPDLVLEELLTQIVGLLPPGWQYPAITQARITLDGRTFSTPSFQGGLHRQSADVLVNDVKRGTMEVVYTEARPESDEGPFLKEERSLLDEIARQVGLIVEHWEMEEDKARLQEQLRHAERLATIGQLSAGVAHELNEPLGAVLGFAQLLKDCPGLPAPAGRDTDKIVNAALHAREVIRKLMLFTRQMPTRKTECDLNYIVKEGLYFLGSRCAKEGIVMVQRLDEDLPRILADPSQLHQVLVNLVVNAIQAMPRGGTLTIKTCAAQERICLVVEDTGVGMPPEIQKQLFMPFFTTKDVGQGTGLGLAVVHGIVSAHGGTVNVKSEVGKGSSFEVCLPAEGPSNSGKVT